MCLPFTQQMFPWTITFKKTLLVWKIIIVEFRVFIARKQTPAGGEAAYCCGRTWHTVLWDHTVLDILGATITHLLQPLHLPGVPHGVAQYTGTMTLSCSYEGTGSSAPSGVLYWPETYMSHTNRHFETQGCICNLCFVIWPQRIVCLRSDFLAETKVRICSMRCISWETSLSVRMKAEEDRERVAMSSS